MTSVRSILGEVGYDMGKYHEESFAFERLPAADVPRSANGAARDAVDSTGDDTPTTYSIEFVRSGRIVTCGARENVLDAALAAGLRLASSCTQGMCGSCKTTMLSGMVDMEHNGGIRPREVAQNKILVCCSKPLSDLRIDS
jgi:ferredoxin